MDDDGSYGPVDTGHGSQRAFEQASQSGVSRGMRIFMAVFGIMGLLLVITFIMSATNSVSNASRESREQSLLQRLAVLSGIASESSHRYRFSAVFDAVNFIPVTNPREYFYGLPSGNPIAIVKGWVDMLWTMPVPDATDTSDSGAIGYNVSFAYPNGRPITALAVAVTTFTARSDRLLQKGTIVLCGSGTEQACLPADNRGTYTGNGIITSGFARRAGTADEMHMDFFLLIYGATNATAPLADEDVLFVIELQR